MSYISKNINMYEKERTLIKWKYLYYNGRTEVPDHVYDKLEDELRQLGSNAVDIVDSPSLEILTKYNLVDELRVGDRGIRFSHPFPMLSLKKYSVIDTDSGEQFPSDIVNFMFKKKGTPIICTPKFDGNSNELIYVYGNLHMALTRGEEGKGIDRTDKVRLIVPNTLPPKYQQYSKVVIRGEVIIPTELWQEKYSNEEKVDNPRNWLAGKLGDDDVNPDVIKDMDFVAYQITILDNGNVIRPENQLSVLNKLGFEEVFSLETYDYEHFFVHIYPQFKEYRIKSKYALDGIVLNFLPKYWNELGEGNHHPHWACALKFPPNKVSTVLEDIEWTLGKDGEYTPIALLRAVELDGTVVKHASLHNLGWIIENKVYPGCVVEIAKKGEIIPAVIQILEKSVDNDEYESYISDFIETFSE